MRFVRLSTPKGYRPPHLINMKGYGRLRVSNRSNTNLFIFFTFSFPISICCSSLVSMAFEDALTGWRAYGNPTRACHDGIPPGRAFVGSSPFCTAIGLTGPSDRSDRSTQEVLQGDPPRTARPSAIVCWPVKGINRSDSSGRQNIGGEPLKCC